MKYIWIVEMLIRGVWFPTVGAGLSRREAARVMRDDWKTNNPTDKFRVAKYTSAPTVKD